MDCPRPARRPVPLGALPQSHKRVHHANRTIQPIVLKIFGEDLREAVVLLRLRGSDCEDLVNRDGCAAEKREWYGVARRISPRATELGHLHGSVGGVHYPEFLRTR